MSYVIVLITFPALIHHLVACFSPFLPLCVLVYCSMHQPNPPFFFPLHNHTPTLSFSAVLSLSLSLSSFSFLIRAINALLSRMAIIRQIYILLNAPSFVCNQCLLTAPLSDRVSHSRNTSILFQHLLHNITSSLILE
eukprot:m.332684 g.332684  ORF g.332684 m.332684 type:complete len:137 (+) comp16061_c1_seq6:625-1035(+)